VVVVVLIQIQMVQMVVLVVVAEVDQQVADLVLQTKVLLAEMVKVLHLSHQEVAVAVVLGKVATLMVMAKAVMALQHP
jgi:hypothetical protein